MRSEKAVRDEARDDVERMVGEVVRVTLVAFVVGVSLVLVGVVLEAAGL